MSSLPPQRTGPGGNQGGAGGRGPGQQSVPRGMSPAQGAQDSERRLGIPCFHVGQIVSGLFGCVACQFQIRNRKALPVCPQCGEIIWGYLEDGPRPVPEGESPVAPADPAAGQQPVRVEEGVDLGATQAPVKVEEGVRLE